LCGTAASIGGSRNARAAIGARARLKALAPPRLNRLALHEPGELADIASRMAHEEAAGWTDGVDNAKPKIAQMPERRDIVGEQPIERVGRSGEGKRIEPPPELITFK